MDKMTALKNAEAYLDYCKQNFKGDNEHVEMMQVCIDALRHVTPINTVKIKLDEGAKMPSRAHEFDAGLDLYAREERLIACFDSACFDTGVHIEIPAGYVGMLKSKSGLNVREGLTGEGVIDCGYTGSIVVKLYNHTERAVKIEKGQKISQLVIMPCLLPSLELVDELAETERGAGGFGSTGRL